MHIGRRDAYPIITATKYYVNAGQRDTFNVRMSDGSAFTMWQWSWLTDQGTAGSTTLGCNWQLPCPNAIIMESGYVRAKVNHGGRFKWTRAHITVGPPPRLQVSPTQVQVLLGSAIGFTTSAGAAPYSISGWKFHHNAIGTCASNKQCQVIPAHSGRLWVYGTVDSRPDSANADVTVTLNSAEQGVGGTVPDSTVVSVLTISSEGGVSLDPPAGHYVYPKDTTIQVTTAASVGYINPVSTLDDTIGSLSRPVSMSVSHAWVAAGERNWAVDAEIGAVASRFHELLYGSADKKQLYAKLMQSYYAAARTNVTRTDSVYAIGELIGIDPFAADSQAMRILDNELAGTSFVLEPSADTIVVTVVPPPIMALRAQSGQANDVVRGDKRIRLIFVNGIWVSYKQRFAAPAHLVSVALEVDSSTRALPPIVEDFYNPTYSYQIQDWDTDAKCSIEYQRWQRFVSPLIALVKFLNCAPRAAVRTVLDRDVVEALLERQRSMHNWPLRPPAFAQEAANRVQTLHDQGVSTVIVGHSQGVMIAHDMLQIVAQNHPLSAPGRCTGVMGLASPIPKAQFTETLLLPQYVQMLTANGDILDYLTGVVDADITHFGSQNSHDADTELASITDTTSINYKKTRLKWAFDIHPVAENYLTDPYGKPLVRGALTNLYSACATAP